MKEIEIVQHGEKTYQVVNGTYYHADTPEAVIRLLESARSSGVRLRLFLGDRITGKDWREENDVLGTIGRSCGPVKIPLLLRAKHSSGGPGILDHCVVKIMDAQTKRVLYQHPKYHLGDFTIKPTQEVPDLPHQVFQGGENIANFQEAQQAVNYVKFLRGERMKA